jgi:hypothetical protein
MRISLGTFRGSRDDLLGCEMEIGAEIHWIHRKFDRKLIKDTKKGWNYFNSQKNLPKVRF